MSEDTTKRLKSDANGIARAAETLAQGGLVAFPTETVYGLGADARNGVAVARIFEAKARPSFNPLIVHVSDPARVRDLARMSPDAERLAAAFWPGALTLVLPICPDAGISSLVTAGGDSVAVRVPDHPVATALLKAFGGPVAAPSANPSGRISPTSAAHVLAGLAGRIDAVLDGGPTSVGLESTIVALSPSPTLLRAGGIPAEEIEACLGRPLAKPVPTARPSAPGQLASHYAPAATVRLNATEAAGDELLIGFGPVRGDLTLSDHGDLQKAAANLFALLHEADSTGRPIAVAPIPDHGLGRAINDRLARAAAPRD
ncbi:threonylcarbamoyl-AMP synthase [Alphaproteobacteria bacterium GH1-50]|uniref:Threonylcarbamoyl-AMP synthase n=1 Tax=Kangsaoukella pontilimi TaxID=2691042 RepID=A0A7C9NGP7_9RHOB|nr:L-threonylcarbamoyladenylate synthase [Kangsaoukella pontilimi]MXQ09599.1 threonylcarbamoyl-AMP synthase [Kangsaoukella pontilimi]